MAVYDFSEQADLDLANLYEYGIETFGFVQARSYILQLNDNFRNLAENPDLGRDASEYATDLKRYSYKAHKIFFKQIPDGIHIIRILGQKMDFGIHL